MCDPALVYAILECLTLLRRACENEFIDEVFSPSTKASEPADVNDSTTLCTSSTLSVRTSLFS